MAAIADFGVALWATFVMPFSGVSTAKTDEVRKMVRVRWLAFGRSLVEFMEVK